MNQLAAKRPRKMKNRLAILLTSTAALAYSAVSAQTTDAENPYWEQYGKDPIEVVQTNNGSAQTLSFTDFKDGMLIAELADGVGEISLPVSESMARSLSLENLSMSEVIAQMADQNYTRALELLRPVAYPLIKFHQVPESFTQLHAPIRRLLDNLLSAELLPEAEDVIRRIELDTVAPEYSEIALRLMNAYLAAGDFERAAQLTRQIPVEGQYAGNIRPIVDAADALRGAGKYDAVIPLYREIETVVPADVKKNVQMWLAYSLVLADRVDEATPLIDKLEEPAPKDRLFSLFNLLHGSREHRLENYGKALDLLSRGFVRAQTSYVWVPEMLYLIGDCYARYDSPLPARNVWTEITLLYPESPWAERAETALATLPKPK